MLKGYRIDRWGRGPLRRDSTLAVGGRPWFAVFETEGDEPVFAPPESVSLAWAARRLWSWRESLRPGQSGVSYEDYHWTVERYRFQDGQASLEWSHPLAMSPPGTPHDLRFVSGTGRRVVQLRYTETDSPGSIFLVLRDEAGREPAERTDRRSALALLADNEAPAGSTLITSTAAAVSAPELAEPDETLRAILAAPDDDEPRLAHARAVGGARGEFIELALKHRKTRAERARQKALLKDHGASWAAALGANKANQRWQRGFLTRATTVSDISVEQLAHPEWGLVEVIPENCSLPPADRMERLVSLGAFNSATYLAGRRSPWPRLERVVARVAEVELLLSRPEHFPALRAVALYDSPESVDLPRLAARLEELTYIGPSTVSFEEVASRVNGSGLVTLVWAPDQALQGKRTFSADADGLFRADGA